MGVARRWFRNESGAALVETALCLPMFLGLLFAILEVGVFGYVQTAFNNAILEAGREIRTGRAQPKDAKALKDLICASMGATTGCANRLSVQLESPGVGTSALAFAPALLTQAGGPDPDPSTVNSGPGKGTTQQVTPKDGKVDGKAYQAKAVVVMTASYQWPLITPFVTMNLPRTASGDVLIIGHLLFKNEPWDA